MDCYTNLKKKLFGYSNLGVHEINLTWRPATSGILKGCVLGTLLSNNPNNDSEEDRGYALTESADDTILERVPEICWRVVLLVRVAWTGQWSNTNCGGKG